MSPETIIAQLEQINSWRRGEESEPQPDPKHVGEVIDAAVASLRSLIASNTTLRRERREARAEVAQLKGALALGQENCDAEYEELREERDKATAKLSSAEEYLRNSGRNMDEAQEQIAERDSKIVTLSADLARATAERQNWKEWAEEARAMFHKQIDAAAVMKTRAEQAEQRVAELDKEAMILRGTVEAVTTQRQQAEQRNAELVAALQSIAAGDGDERRRAEDALARAESTTPDAAECASDYTSQLTEDKRNESAERMAGIQSLFKPHHEAADQEECA